MPLKDEKSVRLPIVRRPPDSINAAMGLFRVGPDEVNVGVEEVVGRGENEAAARSPSSKHRRTSRLVVSGVQPVKKWNWSKPPIMQILSPIRLLASRRSVSPPIAGGVNVSMASGFMAATFSRMGIMPPQVW